MIKPKALRIAKYSCKTYQRNALDSLMPPEKMTVSEWAEKNIMLNGKTSAEPGPWSNRRTPYLVEIMDEFNNPDTEEIVFVKPTQVGGTAGMINAMFYAIAQDPSPIEVVYPTDAFAQSISTKRLQPMIEDCEVIRKKYDHESKDLELDFTDEAMVKLVGSNSPAGVSSFAMKYLFIDEIDKFPGASKKEADPVSLAEERIKTYRSHGAKIFKTSTPTLRDGHIWKAKEAADIEKHYFIPCPHCGAFIELKFTQLVWPGRNKDLIDAYGAEEIEKQLAELEETDSGEGLSDTDRAEFAFYVCQECRQVITDQQRTAAMQLGQWQIVERRSRFARKVCFWINTLYSPFVRFSEIASKFMDSKEDPDKLQNFVNSWLAEPWENTKLKTDSDLVMARQTTLPAYTAPSWAKILTGGVDVQKDCLYWTIRAWGDYLTSQNIAHGQAANFTEVESVMNMQYIREDGTPMIVNLAIIDSGYDSDMVYQFCILNADWATAGKGATHEMNEHYRHSSVNRPGSGAVGLPLVIVDGGKYKDMIAARMRRKNGTGSWMVHRDIDLDYAEQVTAEHKVAVRSGNKTVMRWVQKVSHGDNHYLDCEVYAMAAADILGVRMLHLQNIRGMEEQKQPETTENEETWLKRQEEWI